MKENNELERRDLAIDSEMEVDCDIGQEITVYIETWFDVDKKFGTQIADEDGTWLNLYGDRIRSKAHKRYDHRKNQRSVRSNAEGILSDLL